ncbi:general odorant-binding protein 56a [Drosophila tropicalis]|uniref:general odorant-binding protein 56a n=1 Tax=Drosophila tropicalis TaxID=46794 RepID=UPI0035ABD525
MATVLIVPLAFGLILATVECRYAKINVNLGLSVTIDAPRQLDEDMIHICAHQTEISLEELQKFQQHDVKVNASEATQCFTHCLYEQMGLMHDGVFVEKDFLGLLSDVSNPNTWPQRQCHNLKGDNKCETAYKIHQCIMQLKREQNFERDHAFDGDGDPTTSVTPTDELNMP